MGVESRGYIPDEHKNMNTAKEKTRLQAHREGFDERMTDYATDLGISDIRELQFVYGLEEDNLRKLYEEDPESAFESRSLEHEIIENIKSGIDSLTKIPNRITLIKNFERLRERLKKEEVNMPEEKREVEKVGKYSFIMIDVDKFKSINDNYGHKGGDYVLHEICRVLKEPNGLRKTDMIGRWGGEEIAIIADNVNGSGPEVADRIRELIQNHEFIYKDEKTGKEHQIKVTISAGVSPYNENIEEMVRKSDIALYGAKHAFGAEVLQNQQIRDADKAGESRNQIWYFDNDDNLRKYTKPKNK